MFPSILSLKHPHTGESGAEGSLPPLLAILRFALEAPFLHRVAACRWVVLTDPPTADLSLRVDLTTKPRGPENWL